MHYDAQTRAHLTWRLRCATCGTTHLLNEWFPALLVHRCETDCVHYNYSKAEQWQFSRMRIWHNATLYARCGNTSASLPMSRSLTYCIVFDQRRSCTWMGGKTVSPLL